jgi:hypothetical protein
MNVLIQSLSGKRIELSLDSFDSVNTVKQKIMYVEGIKSCHQRLIFAGKQLYDNMIMKDLNVLDNSIIHLVTNMKGGGDTTQYLEFDSTYRDRGQWKLPAEFEIPIEQSGVKHPSNALDPVSLASIIEQWSGNNFNGLTPSSNISVTVASVVVPQLGRAGTQNSVIVTGTAGQLQLIEGYYNNSVAVHLNELNRIISYKYMGNDRAELTFSSAFPTALVPSSIIVIYDPTDLTSPINPLFFVPNGRNGDNAYANSVLFNESLGQGRNICSYDNNTRLIGVDTSSSLTAISTNGPVTGWSVTDTYSIRKELPVNCSLLTGDINNNPITHTSFVRASAFSGDDLVGSFLEIGTDLVSGDRVGSLVSGGTQSITLQTTANVADNFFIGCTIRMTSGASIGHTQLIISYNGVTKVVGFAVGFALGTTAADSYVITCPSEARRIVKYVNLTGGFFTGSGSTTSATVGNEASSKNKDYIDLYIRVTTGAAAGDIRLISSYTVVTNVNRIVTSRTITPYNAFSAPVVAGDKYDITSGTVSPKFSASISTQRACDLRYSYDNMVPFSYIGTNSNSCEVCYRLELVNLIVPNAILSIGIGSRVMFYQYLYVEICNVTSPTAGARNVLYSNNPHSSRAVFRASIDDTPSPLITTFVRIDGDGMLQTIKFKPNDNLRIKVTLQNGETFNTILTENYSPKPPNALIQISGIIAMTKI